MQLKTGWYHLIALMIAIVWGTTFVSTKILLIAGLSPEDIMFYRFVLAYMGILLGGKSQLFAKSMKDEGLFLLLGIFGGSLYFITENQAVKMTLASNVSLLVSIAPVLTAILSHFFLKNERLRRSLVIGSFIAFVGVVFVVFNGSFVLEMNPWGDLLSIAAAFCWAFYTILLKRVSHRYSILFITRKVFFYGILTILPFFYLNPLTMDTAILFRPEVWINLLFLGLIASLACYFLWNLCVKHLGAIYTTNYIYIIPLVTLITSSLIINENITTIALFGAFLILTGVSLAEKGERFVR